MEKASESSTVFDLLHPQIGSLLRERGILEPTEPQAKVIPFILEGKDVLLLSPTGTGKTEAAIFPIFHKILTFHPETVSTLFITPLRALNRDMLERLIRYGKDLGIRVQVRPAL